MCEWYISLLEWVPYGGDTSDTLVATQRHAHEVFISQLCSIPSCDFSEKANTNLYRMDKWFALCACTPPPGVVQNCSRTRIFMPSVARFIRLKHRIFAPGTATRLVLEEPPWKGQASTMDPGVWVCNVFKEDPFVARLEPVLYKLGL